LSAPKLKSEFLIGAAIGSGSNALAAEHGGADFLLAINAGRFRNMGVPSIACMLPVQDANSLTEGFAREELLALCNIPILLGTNVWGQDFDPAAKANAIQETGFAGAVNFPSCMHYSRPMQQILSRAGRGIEQEVEQLKVVQDAGMIAMFYCATRTQARLAADAGINLICLNIGWNVGGALGHLSRFTIEEVATTARDIGRLIKRINPNAKFLLEGGPIATPQDLSRVLSMVQVDGYVGGSTIDRLPLESSVAIMIDGFRLASKGQSQLDKKAGELLAWAEQFGHVGRCEAQLVMLQRMRALADTNKPVLILAETGQDFMPAVRVLGGIRKSDSSMNIVQIDVAEQDFPARARNVLFGHRDSGATRYPVLADLDVDMVVIHSPERLTKALQRRLVQAIRDGIFRITGSRRSLTVQPRIILLCNFSAHPRWLERDLINAGLENDLVDHMVGWTLRIPPLQERIEDLQEIIDNQLDSNRTGNTGGTVFSPAAFQKLRAHTWPGNEAELHTLLGELADRDSSRPVQPEELATLLRSEREGQDGPDNRSEKDRIVEALWRHGFNRSKTATALGISRKTLYNKIGKFGLSG
jgi:predicted TIM-barrel enzyme/DNA-binding NtrC family response regulator